MQKALPRPNETLAAILRPSRTPLERSKDGMLAALQSKPLYQGTVPATVKARSRAANKAARVARRSNRGA